MSVEIHIVSQDEDSTTDSFDDIQIGPRATLSLLNLLRTEDGLEKAQEALNRVLAAYHELTAVSYTHLTLPTNREV